MTDQGRPCGFVQSLGRSIVRSISHFFWSAKRKLSHLIDRTTFFVQSFLKIGHSNIYAGQKKSREWTKKNCPVSETGQFFLADPKK